MCLVAMAVSQSERFPFVVASNRDEFFDRAAAPLAWWQGDAGASPVLGGRDLSAGGTWLGLNRAGRLALVTNVREPARFEAGLASRGALAPAALAASDQELRALVQAPRNGFNLVVADTRRGTGLWLSNRSAQPRALGPGLFGLSNAALDTPWPKTLALKQRLREAVARHDRVQDLVQASFVALADGSIAADDALPRTGIPLERERQLSAAFIRIPAAEGSAGSAYGTRCSTVVVVEQRGNIQLVWVHERRFDALGQVSGETTAQFQPES